MTFAQRRNRLTTHFSERITVVKRRISVFVSVNLNLTFMYYITYPAAAAVLWLALMQLTELRVHSNAHKVIAGFFLSPDPEVT
jgi:hypothetical protein